MKYRVGDRVKVREDLVAERSYKMEHDPSKDNSVSVEMLKVCGQIVTISTLQSFGQYRVKEIGFNWTDGMFECLESEIKPIKKETKKMTEKEKVIQAKRERGKKIKAMRDELGIERIIVNGKTMVVFFKSGEKVVEKAIGKDEMNIEIGIALAMMHKMAGSKSIYHEMIESIGNKIEKH